MKCKLGPSGSTVKVTVMTNPRADGAPEDEIAIFPIFLF